MTHEIHAKTIVIATQNEKKRAEMLDILKKVPGVLFRTTEYFPFLPAVEEDGHTFQENAIKKASTLAKACNTWALADDSGLEIDALNGRPGIFSSRYAGPNATDEENIEKVLSELRNVPKERRTARFVCSVALASPEQVFFTVKGCCEGVITEEPRGKRGFGYDPIFFVTDYHATFAELSHSIKNNISHRAQALAQFKKRVASLVLR